MENMNPLSAEKQALLELRLRGASKNTADARHLFRRANNDPAPLSFAQFYIWASDQIAPGNPSHNLPVGFRIKGQLDAGRLEDSFNAMARRHETLRTTFGVKDGEPIQVIHPECRIKIKLIELDHLPVDEGEIKLQKLASKESADLFDLSRLPLIRVSLFKLGDTDHVLVVNLHHIIADGLSIGPLLNELDALYKAFKSESPPSLPELPVQYADFASWQRLEFLKNSYPHQAEYWRAQMNRRLRPLALPFDRARPTVRSFSGANVFFSIPTSRVEKLTSLDKEGRGSFFSIALALFQVMLHRYSGSEDMLILTPISIRTQDELRPLIGNFLNLVPLRCDVSGNPSFIELLRRSRETTLDGLSNKDLPFDKIVDGLKIERDSGRDPIFQFLLQVLPASAAKFADLEIGSFQIDLALSQFDLSLHLYERGEGYLGRFEYSTDVFNADTVERLSLNFMRLLEAVVADPNRPIATLPLLSAMDRKAPPAPERSAAQQVAQVAPRTPTEKLVMSIFRSVLERSDFGVLDNFFDLGGHSLMAARLMHGLRAASGVDLPLRNLFEHSTVAALAEAIDGLQWLQKSKAPAGGTSNREEIEL
jgi:acyl carrier protein